jgi:hypothetical protein
MGSTLISSIIAPIDSRHISNLMDVTTFRGANIDSDHFLVVSRIWCRLSNVKQIEEVKVARYDCGKLKIPEITGEYKNKLEEYLRGPKSHIWDSKIWSQVPRDSDPRKTALTRASSTYKRQTQPLIREGAPQEQDHNCHTSNKDLAVSPRWVLYSKTDWPADRRS